MHFIGAGGAAFHVPHLDPPSVPGASKTPEDFTKIKAAKGSQAFIVEEYLDGGTLKRLVLEKVMVQ